MYFFALSDDSDSLELEFDSLELDSDEMFFFFFCFCASSPFNNAINVSDMCSKFDLCLVSRKFWPKIVTIDLTICLLSFCIFSTVPNLLFNVKQIASNMLIFILDALIRWLPMMESEKMHLMILMCCVVISLCLCRFFSRVSRYAVVCVVVTLVSSLLRDRT